VRTPESHSKMATFDRLHERSAKAGYTDGQRIATRTVALRKEGSLGNSGAIDNADGPARFYYLHLKDHRLKPVLPQKSAARTIASVVKKLLSTAPILMYQHSRSGVSMPGR